MTIMVMMMMMEASRHLSQGVHATTSALLRPPRTPPVHHLASDISFNPQTSGLGGQAASYDIKDWSNSSSSSFSSGSRRVFHFFDRPIDLSSGQLSL